MTTKQFYFGVEKKHDKYYATNDNYGVCLKNEAEANRVCNMINDMVKEVNIGVSKLETENKKLKEENQHLKKKINCITKSLQTELNNYQRL